MNQASNAAPDWSQLPHNPVGFFELEAGFDRKALKRKYNRLIRQFKPEKAPAEFQKIRAAYELLDGRLRYGESQLLPTNEGFQWDAAQSNIKSKTENQPTKPTAADELEPAMAEVVEVPIYQRVESESPAAIYKQLNSKTGKTPFEYFCMALLADVASEDSMMFFKVLLTGIQRHPNEPGLANLLYEYLQQDFEPKQIPGLLKTISKVVTDQSFYFLTENLWDHLLLSSDFKIWAATLAQCESNMKEYRIEGQLAFYLHVLPGAIFKAEAKWLHAKFKFLDEHAREIPPSLNMDYELVFQLFEYRRSLASDDSYSPEIHKGIRDYFILGGQRGDEVVIELQTTFAQNPAQLLKQFGPDTPYNGQQLAIWDYVNQDVCQRRDLTAEMNPRQLKARIFDLMDDLNRSEVEGFGWLDEIQYYARRYGPYVVGFVTPFILLSPWFLINWVVLLTIIAAIAAVFLVHFFYRPADRVDAYLEKRMRNRYFSNWRARFVHLFEATQIGHVELSNALIEIVQHHSDKVGFASWIIRFLPADAGLHLFASAARYLK